ncbi:MAG: transposase [Bacteroidetes bacterium]|nr:transposase [Bacteroidota bacterium]
MQGKKQHTEKLFTSFKISDRVPRQNLYRILKEKLDLKFLYPATTTYYGKEGQASIDPVVFFKLILVGYLENLNSDRKIIDHAQMRLDIIYFIGYDIDEELPRHSPFPHAAVVWSGNIFCNFLNKY